MTDLIVIEDKHIPTKLEEHQVMMAYVFDKLNLPHKDIFVSTSERQIVFSNIENLLKTIESSVRIEAYYISKFLAAISSGLFDAALNYIWDETIANLRKKILNYDLDYFFDQITTSPDKKSKFKEDDLDGISDQELIEGARKIELISEVGYKQLDLIRYMRNFASAAHPNQNELTAYQLMGWFDVIIKEVIAIKEPNTAVNIKQLLGNIKINKVDSEQKAKEMISFLKDAPQIQINNLCRGLFGIYTRQDANQISIDNIKLLLPKIWYFVGNSTKFEFGIKYGNFVAINDVKSAEKVKEFLSICQDGLQFLPEGTRILEIEETLDALYRTHNSMNNFYNEVIFAKKLLNVVGSTSIPDGIVEKYVFTLINVAISNGSGVAQSADLIYFDLLSKFDTIQTSIAILSFQNERISSKLANSLCKRKFLEIIEIMKEKTVNSLEKDLIDEIIKFSASFDKLKNDTKMNRFVQMIQNMK
ncbi:hypothetical protein [Aliarcobacter cryaerophilus]|uniref:hypothetical protein n=1 Tax=Aliarcobacter cryaerophilus TaxID=28198 RepID=UPI003DA67F0A